MASSYAQRFGVTRRRGQARLRIASTENRRTCQAVIYRSCKW